MGLFEYQIIRYLVTGGSAFLVDVALMCGATDILGLHYLWGAAAGFIAGLIVNYGLSVSWVFKERVCKKQELEFLAFAVIGVLGLGLNEVLIWSFTEMAGCYPVVSKIITAMIVFFWNYYARKLMLFQARSGSNECYIVTRVK